MSKEARPLRTALALAAVAWIGSEALSVGAETAVQVDSAIPSYKKVSGVSGSLSSIGSDTMNNLMTFWAEGMAKYYPNVRVQVEGKGSSTAPPALIEGTAQLGPMSRPMKQEEIDSFEKKFGYKPTEIRTALDALAVFVNKDNPIKGMTMQQIDGVFSKTRSCGGNAIGTWGELGLSGDWQKRPMSLYGRNSASGTYGFFKEHALCKGDYRDDVKEQPGSASVVQGVTEDRFGIGYSGIGYTTSGVRAVPLAAKAGEPFEPADFEHVKDGSYPMWRYLYVYVNKAPNKELDPLVREFLKFVLSSEGQGVVIKDGYLPLAAPVVTQELAKVGGSSLVSDAR